MDWHWQSAVFGALATGVAGVLALVVACGWRWLQNKRPVQVHAHETWPTPKRATSSIRRSSESSRHSHDHGTRPALISAPRSWRRSNKRASALSDSHMSSPFMVLQKLIQGMRQVEKEASRQADLDKALLILEQCSTTSMHIIDMSTFGKLVRSLDGAGQKDTDKIGSTHAAPRSRAGSGTGCV